MSRTTKDFGDVVVSVTRGELHGLPVVHEVHRHKRTKARSLWYVDAMAILRARPALRQRMRSCVHSDGLAFEKEVVQIAKRLAEQ